VSRFELDPTTTGPLNAAGLMPGGDGGVPLLHATSAGGALAILESGLLIPTPDETEVYAATAPSIAADLSCDVIVPVRVRVDDLRLSQRWPPEDEDPSLVRWEFSMAAINGRYEPLAVGHRAYHDAEANAGPAAKWPLDDEQAGG
jgi:hypothetical protein